MPQRAPVCISRPMTRSSLGCRSGTLALDNRPIWPAINLLLLRSRCRSLRRNRGCLPRRGDQIFVCIRARVRVCRSVRLHTLVDVHSSRNDGGGQR